MILLDTFQLGAPHTGNTKATKAHCSFAEASFPGLAMLLDLLLRVVFRKVRFQFLSSVG